MFSTWKSSQSLVTQKTRKNEHFDNVRSCVADKMHRRTSRCSPGCFADSKLPRFRGLRPPRGVGYESRVEGAGGRRGAEGVDRWIVCHTRTGWFPCGLTVACYRFERAHTVSGIRYCLVSSSSWMKDTACDDQPVRFNDPMSNGVIIDKDRITLGTNY